MSAVISMRLSSTIPQDSILVETRKNNNQDDNNFLQNELISLQSKSPKKELCLRNYKKEWKKIFYDNKMTRNSEQSVIYPLSTFTTLTTLVIVTNKDWKVILNQQHQLFSLISLFVFLTIYGIIITLEQIRFMKGINYIAAFLLAISLGFLIAVESSWYTLATNLNSIFISCIVAITISSMAFSVKRDLTIHMDKLIISTFIFMIAACLIFILSKIIDTSTIRHFYCLGGFLLSCAYIAVDTQSISTKDRYNQLATNEYVLGGVQIFVDFSYLFYYCMGVIGTGTFITTE